MTYKIVLKGMRFFAYHGVLPAEQRRGQAFYVDLEMDCAGPLPHDDDLTQTVDYADVYEVVRQTMAEGRLQLLETLVDRIGRAVLEQFPAVVAVQVAVHKPQAPLPGPVEDVIVSARRQR